jgi:hypothetical protein
LSNNSVVSEREIKRTEKPGGRVERQFIERIVVVASIERLCEPTVIHEIVSNLQERYRERE